MRLQKEQLYALAVVESSHNNWRRYQLERNKHQFAIRNKKRNYIEGKFDKAKGDAKETWKILKTLLNGKRNGEIGRSSETNEN